MIKILRKKISILFAGLLAAIWIIILVMFNWVNYNDGLQRLRYDVNNEIREGGWLTFLSSGGKDEAFDLDGLEYCIFRKYPNGSVSVVANHFPSVSEAKLIKYAQTYEHKWNLANKFSRITSISKHRKRFGNILILLNTQTVLESMAPVLYASFAAAIAGVFVLIVITKKLSGWLVRPVEESMQSEKDFISNASHELKTPLAVVRANIELLEDEIGENKRLQYIDTETKRLISLVNQMLELVRLDAKHTKYAMQSFRVDESLLNVIYPMESVAFEKKVKMDIDVQEEIYLVGNEEQVQSLMAILLDNAISYTPKGGEIAIHAGIHAHKFYLIVANTGEPIPPQQCEKLFERFYRQDMARESTSDHLGLGLSIAEGIVKRHHGRIHVESEGGKNTFYVTLPVMKKL